MLGFGLANEYPATAKEIVSKTYSYLKQRLGPRELMKELIVPSTHYNMSVAFTSFRGLSDHLWLDDIVIDYFTNEIAFCSGSCYPDWPQIREKSIFFGFCYFYPYYVEHKNKFDPGQQYDQIVFVAHVDSIHWILVVINILLRYVKTYDSLMGKDKRILLRKSIIQWAEVNLACSGEWTESAGDCPKQENGYDCGVFAILSAFYISQQKVLSGSTFCQNDATKFRRWMAAYLYDQGQKLRTEKWALAWTTQE